jgi:hypothetical protein
VYKKNRVSKSEGDRETRGIFRISTTGVYEESSDRLYNTRPEKQYGLFKEQTDFTSPPKNSSFVNLRQVFTTPIYCQANQKEKLAPRQMAAPVQRFERTPQRINFLLGGSLIGFRLFQLTQNVLYILQDSFENLAYSIHFENGFRQR